jgi:molybdopterin-binding protein
LATLLEDAGLNQIKRSSIAIRMDYANFEDYWRPLLGGQGPVGIYVAELSSELRCRIEEAVKGAYCSGAPDGERSLTATAWAVRGIVPQLAATMKEHSMKLSARNQLKGKIVDVMKGATTSHVRVDIGGGVIVTSSITNEAVTDLALAKGDEVWAVIKASDVMIGK